MTKNRTLALEKDHRPSDLPMPRRLLAEAGVRLLGFWRQAAHFLGDALAIIWQSGRPVTWRRPVRAEFMRQCYQAGARALPFIGVSGIIVGFGIVAQALHWLEVFGGTSLFGVLLSVVLVGEIAPVLVGLIVIGRSGSVMLVELSNMMAEGQVRMLDAQGVDPFIYLVVPRVLALSLCMFCLTTVFVMVAMVAGFASGTMVAIINLTFFDFIDRALAAIGPAEYLLFTAKTFTIGFVVALITCRTALSLKGTAVNMGDIIPRGFAKSVLAALVISITLTILF